MGTNELPCHRQAATIRPTVAFQVDKCHSSENKSAGACARWWHNNNILNGIDDAPLSTAQTWEITQIHTSYTRRVHSCSIPINDNTLQYANYDVTTRQYVRYYFYAHSLQVLHNTSLEQKTDIRKTYIKSNATTMCRNLRLNTL